MGARCTRFTAWRACFSSQLSSTRWQNGQSPKVEVLGSPLTHISSLADAMVRNATRDRDAAGELSAQVLTLLRRGTAVNIRMELWLFTAVLWFVLTIIF